MGIIIYPENLLQISQILSLVSEIKPRPPVDQVGAFII